MAEKSVANIYIVNNLGKVVKIVYQGSLDSGEHSFLVNSDNLQDGMYFLVMQTSREKSTHKMMVAR